ncbi:hypothetical protein L2E82_10229 [Cichorium intybus]|uniref:Uncharacterized protein n=1 Tax=Cichorium intybus TaxID=13427 RepID=A0ACB9GA25_CICIN|nr:hypothetical protein L2E82_10229 [Cichorium intybus]
MFESANNENKSDDLDSPLCISIEEQIDFFSKSVIVSIKARCRSSPHLGYSPPHPPEHILLDLTPKMRDNLHQISGKQQCRWVVCDGGGLADSGDKHGGSPRPTSSSSMCR